MSPLKLDSEGYFADERGGRFIPFGANYWPASCGVEMWQAWPEDEILADLDLMVSFGFNTVRFFVRWPDFEPVPGRYDEVALARLRRLLEACVGKGLRPQPSLFVGWMSGGTFWPPWKSDTQNVFSDPVLVERGEAYARMLAGLLAPFADDLCGIDVGNELNALSESSEASPTQVVDWCRRMTTAIRDELPDVVILSGCDHQQVIGDTGWRLGDQPGIDVLTMHGYPVPGWHSVPCGGLQDPLTQSLLPFYVKCARVFGPVMLQEFGTILTRNAGNADAYLRAILPACRAAGANGYLWWCFKDISARVHPYVRCNFESELGLVDSEGRVKPGLESFVDFDCEPAAAEDPADVHLYWPVEYYDRNAPLNPGNRPRESSRRMIIAHHLLERSGRSVSIVRGDRPFPADVRRIVVAGVFLTLNEVETLTRWVEQGGELLWHGPDPLGWGAAAARLIGAMVGDYHASCPVQLEWEGRTYSISCHPRGIRVQAQLCGAHVLCADVAGFPVVVERAIGRGRVVTVLADVEASILSRWQEDPTLAEQEWRDWYAVLSKKETHRILAREASMPSDILA